MPSDGIAVYCRRRCFFTDWRLVAGRAQAQQHEQGYHAHPRRLSCGKRRSQFTASVFASRAVFLTACSMRFKKSGRAVSKTSATSRSSIWTLLLWAQYRRFVTSGLLRKSGPKLQHQRTNSFACKYDEDGGASNSEGDTS